MGLRGLVTRLLPDKKRFYDVYLGTGLRDSQDFTQSFLRLGVVFTEDARALLDSIKVAEDKTKLKLVVVSVKSLGIKGGARYDMICARAGIRGLGLCPTEVGPQICVQLSGQFKEGDNLVIAMEPIVDKSKRPWIFNIVNGVKVYFSFLDGRSETYFSASQRFVFVKQ